MRRRTVAGICAVAALAAAGNPAERLAAREAEAATEWRLLSREREGAKTQPPEEEALNRQALILEGDRDALDVLLRRTRALADDLGEAVDGKLAEQLAALESAAKGVAAEDAEARYELFRKAMGVRRKIAFANPLLKDIDKLLFITREALPPNEFHWGMHMCDQFFGFHATQKGLITENGLWVLENPFDDEKRKATEIACGKEIASGAWKGQKLTKYGGFLSPDVSWDGKRILFSYTKGEPRLREWDDATTFHVFSINADGTDLRMLTSGDKNDLFPCWLADDRIIFCSERRGGYGRCHWRKCPNFTLHSMNADGSGIECLSLHETNEFEPSVDNNGMVVYTRWDYVDRGYNQAHHPWITYPDGRDPREFNGNMHKYHRKGPHFVQSIRAIPGSRKYVATACGHHTLIRGSMIMIDPSVPDDGVMSQVKRITPEQPLPESEVWHSGAYATPWPLSEKYFLCVYDGDANAKWPVAHNRRHYALALVDAFGNRIRLHKNASVSCMEAIPLRARTRPPVIPSMIDKTKPATIGCINVKNSRYAFPEGVEIKQLRIWQILPKTEPLVGVPRLGVIDQTPARQCLGTVPVEEDGSVHFRAPENVPLYFQALDAEGCAVQTMRSATYVRPGERLTCNGCHENRHGAMHAAAGARAGAVAAMKRKPSEITPEVEGSKPWNYPRVVQGVLDRKCVACHSPEAKGFDAKKMPDLRKGDIEKNPFNFHTSFIELMEREMVQYYTVHYKGKEWYKVRRQRDDFTQPHSEPGKVGARGSKLYAMLKRGHHGVKLDAEEWRRLTIFMDAQGAYISHDYKAKEQCEGKVVEPSLE